MAELLMIKNELFISLTRLIIATHNEQETQTCNCTECIAKSDCNEDMHGHIIQRLDEVVKRMDLIEQKFNQSKQK